MWEVPSVPTTQFTSSVRAEFSDDSMAVRPVPGQLTLTSCNSISDWHAGHQQVLPPDAPRSTSVCVSILIVIRLRIGSAPCLLANGSIFCEDSEKCPWPHACNFLEFLAAAKSLNQNDLPDC